MAEEGIRIPVTPEVNFDPAVFASFQNAAVRAASNVVAATNRASKAQQTLGFNIQTTGSIATKAAAQIVAAQSTITNATVQGTARRVQAIQQQTQAVQQLTQAMQQLGAVPMPTLTGGAGGGNRGAGLGNRPATTTAALMAGNQVSQAIGQGTSNVLGMGREVSRGMGFDFDISNSMQRNLSIGREATQLAVQGQSPDVKGTAADIESQARGLALKTGLNVEDIIKGLRSFHAYTGDLALGMKQLGNISNSSVAYDTDIKEMASLYAVITKYMGSGATAKGVDALVRSIATQGREGAVEIRDQIKQDPKILVGAQNFGVSKEMLKAYGGDKAAAQAGVALGLQQALMGVSTESAQQTGNAVKSFMETIAQPNAQKGFAKHGVDIFTKDENGKKVFKPLEELLPIAVGISQQDPTFARELMPNVRGRKAIQGLSVDARKAYDESLKNGTSEPEAEKAAIAVALNQMRDAAMKFQDEAGRMADVENVLTSEAGNAAMMQAKVREAMDQATKSILETVSNNQPQIEAGIRAFSEGIKLAAEHPKSAMVAAFSVPIMQQAVGNALGTTLTPALAGIVGALGPFGFGILAVTAAMGALMMLAPDSDDDAVPKPGEGAAGAPGNPTDSHAGAEGGRSTESKYLIAQRVAREQWKELASEGDFMTPAPGGSSSNPASQSVDLKYEEMKRALDAALHEKPIKVDLGGQGGAGGAPNRQEGVIVE